MKDLYSVSLNNIIDNVNLPLLSAGSVVFVPCNPSPFGVFQA